MKSKSIRYFILCLLVSACSPKKNSEIGQHQVVGATMNGLEMAKQKILSSDRFHQIDCQPFTKKKIPGSEKICFGGVGETEDFIQFFTEDIARLGSGNVYWNRDFGLWHAKFDFKDSKDELVLGVMMKGDSEMLQNEYLLKKYDMLIECTFFPASNVP